MSACDSWMDIQMAAIFGNAEALAAIDKVAAELGPHATDAEREAVWQRMLKENAEEKAKNEPEEPDARRPRLNTEDVEEVRHDDQGRPQMRMVNDEPPSGRLEGNVLVYDPRGVDKKPTEVPAQVPAEVPTEVPTEAPKIEESDEETDTEEIARDVKDPEPSATAVQKFALLEPFMTRPREVYYSFKDITEHQAIIVRPPRFNDGCLDQSAETLTDDKSTFSERFLEKPKVLRRVNLLKFRVKVGASLPELFKLFCDGIRLVPSDFVNVYKIDEEHVWVLWRKDDQRLVTFPTDLHFVDRHTLSSAGGTNVQSVNSRLRSAPLALQLLPSITCMKLGRLHDMDPSSILAVCRDKSRFELLVARLVAQMTPDNSRSGFDRALVSGWGTIKELLEPLSNKLDKVLYFVMDSRIPPITDYEGFKDNGYDCFDLKGEYFDVDLKSMTACTLKEVMSKPKHQAHYSRRSIVFMGATRDGKTELAKILARRLAVIHQREVPMTERKFVVVRGVEQLKSDELRSHMTTNVPLVFDDLMPGKCMHRDAEPTSFLKNFFEPVPGELYCRYVCANLAACPHIFTTNEGELNKWLALRPDHGELTDAHKNAVLARTVFFRTTRKLYSPNQNAASAEVNVAEHLLAKTELRRAKELGF